MADVKKVKIDIEVKDKTSKPEDHGTDKAKMVTFDIQDKEEKLPRKMILPVDLKSLLAVMVPSLFVVYSVCACVVKRRLHGLEILGLKQCFCDFLQFLINKIDESLVELGGNNGSKSTDCFLLTGIVFLFIAGFIINRVQIHFQKKSTVLDFKDTQEEKVRPKPELDGDFEIQAPIPTLYSNPGSFQLQGPLSMLSSEPESSTPEAPILVLSSEQESSMHKATIPTLSSEPESFKLQEQVSTLSSESESSMHQASIPMLSPLPAGSQVHGDIKDSEIQQMSHEDVVAAMKLWNGSPDEKDTDWSQSEPSEPRRGINGDPGPHPILFETNCKIDSQTTSSEKHLNCTQLFDNTFYHELKRNNLNKF